MDAHFSASEQLKTCILLAKPYYCGDVLWRPIKYCSILHREPDSAVLVQHQHRLLPRFQEQLFLAHLTRKYMVILHVKDTLHALVDAEQLTRKDVSLLLVYLLRVRSADVKRHIAHGSHAQKRPLADKF